MNNFHTVISACCLFGNTLSLYDISLNILYTLYISRQNCFVWLFHLLYKYWNARLHLL